jgi:hypothetical protein
MPRYTARKLAVEERILSHSMSLAFDLRKRIFTIRVCFNATGGIPSCASFCALLAVASGTAISPNVRVRAKLMKVGIDWGTNAFWSAIDHLMPERTYSASEILQARMRPTKSVGQHARQRLNSTSKNPKRQHLSPELPSVDGSESGGNSLLMR